MDRFIAFSAALALALPACGRYDQNEAAPPAATPQPDQQADRGGVKRASATPLKPLAHKKFGAEITEQSSIPLPQLMREPGKFATRTVRTEGVVSAVCKAQGCWMELADDAGQAHIKMAGHSFFVPRDSQGHRAVVQGKIVNLPKDDECAEEAREQTGQVAKVEIEATGVEFVD